MFELMVSSFENRLFVAAIAAIMILCIIYDKGDMP